mgnify:CR=1 FL=1|jgi:hypothetical protein
METTKLKSEFEQQIKDANERIAKSEAELVRLKEYRTKLQGGLETIALLEEGVSEEETPSQPEVSPEAVALQ